MAINQWNRAVVTGASSGIGNAIARRLAAEGTDLVIVARDADRLKALADELQTKRKVEVEVLPADLVEAVDLGTVEDRLRAEERPIDLLVNNAGFGTPGPFVDISIATQVAMVNLNVIAAQRLAHAAGGTMKARGRGGILNVSSIAGYLPSPYSATYSATKAFLTSLSESLHLELIDEGVTVTALCPGLTHTEFHERSEFDVGNLPDMLWQEAEEVARAGLRGLAERKVVVVPGTVNKTATAAAKAVPQALVRKLSKSFRPQRD